MLYCCCSIATFLHGIFLCTHTYPAVSIVCTKTMLLLIHPFSVFCCAINNFFHSRVRDSLKISCVLIIVITVVSLYALMHDVIFFISSFFSSFALLLFFSVSNVVINLIPSKFELYFDLTSPDKPFKHIVRSHAINNIEQTLSQILLKRQRRRQRRFLSFCWIENNFMVCMRLNLQLRLLSVVLCLYNRKFEIQTETEKHFFLLLNWLNVTTTETFLMFSGRIGKWNFEWTFYKYMGCNWLWSFNFYRRIFVISK